jgi:hypothetical protein
MLYVIDIGFSCADSPLSKVSRYLFPFVLEYCLIALGTIAFILFNGIGTTHDMHGPKKVARGFKNLIRVFSDNIYMDKENIETGNDNSMGAFSFNFPPRFRRRDYMKKKRAAFSDTPERQACSQPPPPPPFTKPAILSESADLGNR